MLICVDIEMDGPFNLNREIDNGDQYPYMNCLFCKKPFNNFEEFMAHERSEEHKKVVNDKFKRMHDDIEMRAKKTERKMLSQRKNVKRLKRMARAATLEQLTRKDARDKPGPSSKKSPEKES
ncbi:unnamed protein product [Hermetia illucens]|nr:unnamed protein product [Hermetia illucens]